jgi:hypothetical protein
MIGSSTYKQTLSGFQALRKSAQFRDKSVTNGTAAGDNFCLKCRSLWQRPANSTRQPETVLEAFPTPSGAFRGPRNGLSDLRFVEVDVSIEEPFVCFQTPLAPV